ncbi:hypothetical protein HS121_14315 [bacterium]|nr:hypothetical protein [bacterium]
MTRSLLNSYSSPGSVQVSLQVNMNGVSSSLGLKETVPSGWTLTPQSISDGWSQAGNQVEKFIPSGQNTSYSYTLQVPAGQSGDKSFVGEYEYTSGDTLQTCSTKGIGTVSQSSHHNADTNNDLVMALSELVYMGRLYHNPGHQYYCGNGTDGYSVTPGPRDCNLHSGDYRKSNDPSQGCGTGGDWAIDLSELVYAGRLYNSGRNDANPANDGRYWPGNGCDGFSVNPPNSKDISQELSEKQIAVSAERSLSATYQPMAEFSVNIEITVPDGVSTSLGIKETVPDGWVLSQASKNAGWTQSGNLVELFIPAAKSETVNYVLNPPEGDCGERDFSGEIFFTDGDLLMSSPITGATTTTCQTQTGCDSGLYLLLTTGQIERVGNPVVINGSVPVPNDLARDLERAIANNGVGPKDDLVVLDGSGVAHFVENPGDDIPQDFFFQPTASFPLGRAVDLEMSQSSEGFWVLTDYGAIYRAGDTKEPGDPAMVPNTDQIANIGYDIPFGMMRDQNFPNPGGATIRGVALVVIDANAAA